MENNKKTNLIFIASMFIFGTLALFVKKINLSSGEIALYRAILASLVIGIYLLLTKQSFNKITNYKDLILIIISGIAMGFNWVFLFQAYNYTSVSIATLSYYFAPIFVTILSPFLFKEKITVKKLICFIMASIGIMLITGVGNLGDNKNNVLGIVFGLIAASLYASVVLLNKSVKTIGGIQRTFIQFISATMILIPYVLLTSGITIIDLSGTGWIYLLIVGIIHTGITYCLYFTTLKDMPGQRASILSYIDPLVAIIISVVILKESISYIQIIGGCLILIFTLINEINFKKNIELEK